MTAAGPHLQQRGGLVGGAHGKEAQLEFRGEFRVGVEPHELWRLQPEARELCNRGRQRCREEEDLPRVCRLAHNVAHLLSEAELEEPVCFVEDDVRDGLEAEAGHLHICHIVTAHMSHWHCTDVTLSLHRCHTVGWKGFPACVAVLRHLHSWQRDSERGGQLCHATFLATGFDQGTPQ